MTWRDFLGSSDSSHYSALKQINRSNVGKLQIAWTYSTGDDEAYVFNPLIVDNVMYVSAEKSSVVAVDAVTGKELWVHPMSSDVSRLEKRRGLNYWESKDRLRRNLQHRRNIVVITPQRRHGLHHPPTLLRHFKRRLSHLSRVSQQQGFSANTLADLRLA